MKKILLTGGGTAGHIMPIIAIAKVLQGNQRVKIRYIGSRQGMERSIAQDNQIPFTSIMVGKWRPYFSLSNFWDLFKTFLGLIQALFILIFFRPNVIFAKGGYVTFPILFWAKALNIPYIIHESDTIIGKANRWALPKAKKICLGFPTIYYPNIPLEKSIYTGTPVDKKFFELFDLKINNPKPVILITGGSQGAQKINDIIWQILPELTQKYEVYHLIGEKNLSKFQEKKINNSNYHAIGFTDEMSGLMAKADLVISRASASTLSEISALAKPAILIPLSTATMDHQTMNAKVYQDHSAAVMLSEKNLTSNSLLSIINRLMEDDQMREMIGHHAHGYAQKDSAQQIIDILFEVFKVSKASREPS